MSKNEGKRTFKVKLVIIGDFAVGKTSLIKKFVSDSFSNDYRASIGTNLYITKFDLEQTHIDLQIWDIAAQERWIKSRGLYYTGASGALIVGDLTREKTFEQIESFWAPDLRSNEVDSPVILLANKSDLKKKISKKKVKKLGQQINAISVLFTSAKTGDNVMEAFKLIAKQAINR